jgi:hypothetical protein
MTLSHLSANLSAFARNTCPHFLQTRSARLQKTAMVAGVIFATAFASYRFLDRSYEASKISSVNEESSSSPSISDSSKELSPETSARPEPDVDRVKWSDGKNLLCVVAGIGVAFGAPFGAMGIVSLISGTNLFK